MTDEQDWNCSSRSSPPRAGFYITVKRKSGPIKSVKFANPDGD